MLYHEKVDIQVNKVDIQTEKFTSKVFFQLIRLILEEYQILMIMLFKMPFDFFIIIYYRMPLIFLLCLMNRYNNLL